MGQATENDNGNVGPLHHAASENAARAESAAPITGACEIFNVAPDFVEGGQASVAHMDDCEKTWLPTLAPLPIGSPDGLDAAAHCTRSSSAFSQLQACDSEHQDPLDMFGGRNAMSSVASAAHQLVAQVQALCCVNANVIPGDESKFSGLLTIVGGHATAADTLAREYSCAMGVAWEYAQHRLAACNAQCSRLNRARQAYTSGLHRLVVLLACTAAKSASSPQRSVGQHNASLVADLLKLEKFRDRAERQKEKQFLRDWIDLNKMQNICRRKLNAGTGGCQEQLNRLLEIEKAALNLLHASKALNPKDMLLRLRQTCQGEADAAAVILSRIENASGCLCQYRVGDSDSECQEIRNLQPHQTEDSTANETANTFADSSESYSKHFCVGALLRLLSLEHALSEKLTEDATSLLRLVRLTVNLAAAAAHLGMFTAQLVGLPSQSTLGKLDPFYMQNFAFQEAASVLPFSNAPTKCSAILGVGYPTLLISAKHPLTSQRLQSHGVAFQGGALLRAGRFPLPPR